MLRYGLLLAAAWFALDHTTKWLIREKIMNPPRQIPVTGFFNVVLGYNTGVSFGMLSGLGLPPWALSLAAIAVATALILWLGRTQSGLVASALGLLIGGALSNGLDRLRNGAVTDFLDFHVAGWHWPAFNVADVGVVCGVVLLMLDSFLGHGVSARASRSF